MSSYDLAAVSKTDGRRVRLAFTTGARAAARPMASDRRAVCIKYIYDDVVIHGAYTCLLAYTARCAGYGGKSYTP